MKMLLSITAHWCFQKKILVTNWLCGGLIYLSLSILDLCWNKPILSGTERCINQVTSGSGMAVGGNICGGVGSTWVAKVATFVMPLLWLSLPRPSWSDATLWSIYIFWNLQKGAGGRNDIFPDCLSPQIRQLEMCKNRQIKIIESNPCSGESRKCMYYFVKNKSKIGASKWFNSCVLKSWVTNKLLFIIP